MGHSGGMARTLCLQYPGAIYHVMSRGDRREAVFSGVAAGNDDGAQMDLRPAGDGVLEIRQPEAL
jgi:hypothetical protein